MASWKKIITTGDDSDYKNSNIVAGNIPADSIDSTKIADDAVTSDHLAANSVDRFAIADNQVRSDAIGPDAVTYSKMQNVATANRVLGSTSADGVVTELQVVTALIADNAVTTAKINADAITGAKIANDSIDSEHYVDRSIDTAHLEHNAVTAAKISPNIISGLSAETSIANDDLIMILDASADSGNGALRQMTKANFVSGLLASETGDIESVSAGNGLSGGGDSGAVSLAVSVDDTTIEINSDAVRAKTGAIADGGTALATADQIHTFVTGSHVGNIEYVTLTSDSGASNKKIYESGNAAFNLIGGAGIGVTNASGVATFTFAVDSTVVRTTGTQSIAGNKTFADNVVITGDLTVNGTNTTINTTTLAVEDKLVTLANVTTPTETTGNGAGIQIETSATEAEWPEFKWDKDGQLTGWTLADHKGTSNEDFPVSVMKFGTSAPSGAPDSGAGTLFSDTSNNNAYIYI